MGTGSYFPKYKNRRPPNDQLNTTPSRLRKHFLICACPKNQARAFTLSNCLRQKHLIYRDLKCIRQVRKRVLHKRKKRIPFFRTQMVTSCHRFRHGPHPCIKVAGKPLSGRLSFLRNTFSLSGTMVSFARRGCSSCLEG